MTSSNRKFCKLCRYTKCLSVGMRPELVDVNIKKENMEDHDNHEEADARRNTDYSDDQYLTDYPMLEILIPPKEERTLILEEIETSNQETLCETFTLSYNQHIGSKMDHGETEMNKDLNIGEHIENNRGNVSVISYCSQKNEKIPSILSISDSGSESEETNNKVVSVSSEVIPFKKRDSVKEWLPYCHTLSMQVGRGRLR